MRFNFKHRKRMTQTSIKVDGSFHGSGDPAGKSHFSAASRGNGARKRVRLMVDDEDSKKSVEEKHTSDNQNRKKRDDRSRQTLDSGDIGSLQQSSIVIIDEKNTKKGIKTIAIKQR